MSSTSSKSFVFSVSQKTKFQETEFDSNNALRDSKNDIKNVNRQLREINRYIEELDSKLRKGTQESYMKVLNWIENREDEFQSKLEKVLQDLNKNNKIYSYRQKFTYEKKIADLENTKSEVKRMKEENVDSVALLHDLIQNNFEGKSRMLEKDVKKEFKTLERNKNAQNEKIELLKRKKSLKEILEFTENELSEK